MAFEMFPVWMMRTTDAAPDTANEQSGTVVVVSDEYKSATKGELEAITAALKKVHDERDATIAIRKQVACKKTSSTVEYKPASKEVVGAIAKTLKEAHAESDAKILTKYAGKPASKADLDAITAALKECNDERDVALAAKAEVEAEEVAGMKHTGIGSEGGCHGCQREYRLNGQPHAYFAAPDIGELTTSHSKEKKGGPLDDTAADCVAM